MTSLVDSVVYRDGKRIGDVPIADIGEAIKQAGTFVWLGLHEPDDAALRKIQLAFGLHELAIEDAHHAHQRPKIEAYSNSLFIVLKTAQLQASHVVYGETHLFVGTNFLVSVRHGASSSFAQVLQRCEDGTKDLPKGPGFALYAILAIPTVIFSLYGMNFEWMPELKWKAGYPMAVAVTALGCVLVYRRLRRAGWV
jgi:magnesium transporter